MLWVPTKGIIRVEHNAGNVGDSTPGTVITTGASSSTKGTAVEMIASTSFDAYWITIIALGYGNAATNSKGCLDILTGASTEEVLIPDLLMGACGGRDAVANSPKRWDFPLYIPAGSRLAAQAAGERTSTALNVLIYLYGGNGNPPFRVGSKVTTYGTGTVPAGTTVTPGASGAEGSWTEITSSTSEDHFAFVPSYQPGTGDTTLTNANHLIDLGVGSVTEEALLGSEQSYSFHINSDECCAGPMSTWPCFQDVPSGSRLVMRASSSAAADGSTPAGSIHAVS